MSELSDLLAAVEDVALQVGEIILHHKSSADKPDHKGDGSPVTAADKAADAFITEHLGRLLPGVPIISEEGVESESLPALDKGRFWLVDPIDGTAQFIKGTGLYTTAIALVENHTPILGLFYYPESGIITGGAEVGSAYRRHKQDKEKQKLQIVHPHPPKRNLDIVVAGTNDLKEEDMSLYLRALPFGIRSIERVIGMEKYFLVANNSKDLFIRLKPTHEWDVAPGHAIVKAAGGVVETIYGAPMVYGNYKKRTPPFVGHGGRLEFTLDPEKLAAISVDD